MTEPEQTVSTAGLEEALRSQRLLDRVSFGFAFIFIAIVLLKSVQITFMGDSGMVLCLIMWGCIMSFWLIQGMVRERVFFDYGPEAKERAQNASGKYVAYSFLILVAFSVLVMNKIPMKLTLLMASPSIPTNNKLITPVNRSRITEAAIFSPFLFCPMSL